MNKRCYINGIGSITSQGIWREDLWKEAVEVNNSLSYAKQPSYKELIPPTTARRMSKGIKMGIFASQQALDGAGNPEIEAIITGTSLGCLQDSEKFLFNILDDDEEFLTPTPFIQSTHNTVGAQIALRLGCNAYNVNYVNGANSFESSLLDALMQIQCSNAHNILVGGVDEIFGIAYELKRLIKEVKQEDIHETVRSSTCDGVNFGDNATFVALSTQKTSQTYAEVVDVEMINKLELFEIESFVNHFLSKNGVSLKDISLEINGRNGDTVYDAYYDKFSSLLKNAPHIYYKNLIGQSGVASAFGMATAADILREKRIPEILRWQGSECCDFKYMLHYSQYLGRYHGLILLKSI